jgi:hypothetical protein
MFRRGAGVCVVAVAAVAAGPLWSHPETLAPPSKSAVAVTPRAQSSPLPLDKGGFTVGYLPPGFKHVATHRGPTPSSRQFVVKGYETEGRGQTRQVLTVDVQRGDAVSLARYARDNGHLRGAKAGDYRAVMGWNTGTPGDGLHIIYVVVSPGVAFEVMQIATPASRTRLIDSRTLLRVAASVRVS